MYLTDEQKRMLDGEYGEGTALAMRVQVGIGEAFGAERMLPITRAHVALSNQDADVWFAEKLAGLGAKCRIAPTTNPGFDVEYFNEHVDLKPVDMEQMNRTLMAYQKLGAILNFSCTPYLYDNIPRQNEICAFSESSATPYMNAIYGAKSNRESALSALCAGITGVVPEYGLLLDENRKGEILVEVEADLTNDFDYQLLGYAVPKKIGHKIPVFSNLPQMISPEAIMYLCAELNTAGAVPMFHILGVTPEAKTLEEAFGKRDYEIIKITNEDLQEVHEKISERAGKIDFVLLGCPHVTLDQVIKIAHMVEGEKLKSELWINTSAHTKDVVKRMGLLEVIEAAGGHVVKDTCIDQPIWHHLEGKLGATESPKCSYYAKRRQLNFVIRPFEQCIQGALKGEIQ
ncbi:aconitase X catalytic domain-containing protein [Terrilactibacillus laevilacticus]|uniref:Aconitase X catalytic domain-containing protein n=2 Tax=Terrilactibacillus laevilacticus TaxID=1380157 RepID=A0ABW5PNJ9_9BACI